MTISRRTSPLSIGLIGAALLAGLLTTGCSRSSHEDDAAAVTTTPASTFVVLSDMGTTTVAPTTTVAQPAPTPAPAPAPDPAPPADPTTTTTSPVLQLIPPGGLVIQASVTSIHGRKSFTCAEAASDDYGAEVSWTTAFASKVNVTVAGWGVVTYYDQPINGSRIVGIPCGTTVTVTVTAIAANGVVGTSKSLKIVIDAPL